MTTRLRFFGVEGYEISGPDFTLLVDPYLVGNPVAPCLPEDLATPDLILATHGAFDHIGDTAAIATRTGAPVLCGPDVRMKLIDDGVDPDQVQGIVPGIRTEIGGVLVTPIESHHASQVTLKDGRVISSPPLGFMFDTEPGVRIYHTGDTAITYDMHVIAEIHAPTVGIMGCAQPLALLPMIPGPGTILSGEMNSYEAALASEWLGLECAVASHYLQAQNPQVTEFIEQVHALDTSGRRVALAPEVGDTIVIDPPSYVVEAG